MTLATRVTPDQRATRFHSCPICEGYDSMRRGRGERCKGYQSNDERFYFCSREEYAGNLKPNANGDYKHRIDGEPCYCGRDHGVWTPPALPKPVSEPKPVTARSGPLPRTITDDDGVVLTYAGEYPYRRVDGSLAYRVARYHYPLKPGETKPQKTFRQFRQIDATTWAWGLGDAERVLYRLPEILAAPAHRPVFVVEGEKCADALTTLGLIATTCPEGAGKWANVPGRHHALRGRPVVILPDNDDKGQQHAQIIAQDLAGVAASVRVLNLPNLPAKGDAVEWIAAGGTALQLLELAIATPACDTAPAQESCPGSQVVPPETLAALKVAETTVGNLRARDAWEAKLRRNPQLRGNYKTTLAHVFDEWHSVAREPQSWMRVYRPTYAKKLGVSQKSVSTHLEKLEKAGAIERHVEQTYDPQSGLARNHLSIRPTDRLLQQPDAIEMPGWGGKRVKVKACPHCKTINPDLTCRACGCHLKADELIDMEVGDEEDATGDMPESRNSCPGSQVVPPGDEGRQETDPEARPGADYHFPSADEDVAEFVPREADAGDELPADILMTMPLPGVKPAPRAPASPPDRCVDGHAHRYVVGECLVCGARKGGAA